MKLTVRDIDGKAIDLAGVPFQLAGATLPAPTAPPRLGEHTDAVLHDVLGMDAAAIARLRQDKVI
jgi:crotonobetainyl-CoA:carnitine CoA-transferase CaiB-like acyl-CoA transferase